jgi:hypothetical protein
MLSIISELFVTRQLELFRTFSFAERANPAEQVV